MTDFSKIGKSNRSRGASYERKICKLLTGPLKAKFKRSPRSGALLREGAINGAFISGDLVCEKDFVFSIECKNCAGVNVISLLKNKATAPIIKYWCQAVYDANAATTEKSPKFPMLFFNADVVKKDFACISKEGLEYLKYMPQSHLYVSRENTPVEIKMDNMDVIMEDIPDLYIFLAEELVCAIDPDKAFVGD